ncbi:actin-related protein 10 [Halyomorpha halys]|uniref:actin-related protein 10 n=1 Tax=Halyomorpha halys TaxID=286706 RepID=UPI0006D527A5|nr:actin-related protein 10 [Halyomorpha halys]
MSIYDGLTAGKPAVVVDFGARYTKFGFAGEFSPRCIIPTQVICPSTGKLRWVFDYEDEADLYALLVTFIHKLYFRHALVSPKDRDVVVIESLLSPTKFRDAVAKVFFLHYEVSSLLYLPSHLIVLAGLGLSTALVVDVGYSESQVIPVFEGVPVLNAWQAQPIGSKAVEERLRKNLKEAYEEIKNAGGDASRVLKPTDLDLETLPDYVIEDIKVRTCFVTTYERGKAMADGIRPPQPPFADYRLGGYSVLRIPGEVREATYEVVFERDNEQSSLANLILESILKCGIDTRRVLAENLVIVGGTSMAPGFKSRLITELRRLVKDNVYKSKLYISNFKVHVPLVKENIASWLGGSIFGATDMLPLRALTKEKYFTLKTVPDWCNLSTNELYLSKLTLS